MCAELNCVAASSRLDLLDRNEAEALEEGLGAAVKVELLGELGEQDLLLVLAGCEVFAGQEGSDSGLDKDEGAHSLSFQLFLVGQHALEVGFCADHFLHLLVGRLVQERVFLYRDAAHFFQAALPVEDLRFSLQDRLQRPVLLLSALLLLGDRLQLLLLRLSLHFFDERAGRLEP